MRPGPTLRDRTHRPTLGPPYEIGPKLGPIQKNLAQSMGVIRCSNGNGAHETKVGHFPVEDACPIEPGWDDGSDGYLSKADYHFLSFPFLSIQTVTMAGCNLLKSSSDFSAFAHEVFANNQYDENFLQIFFKKLLKHVFECPERDGENADNFSPKIIVCQPAVWWNLARWNFWSRGSTSRFGECQRKSIAKAANFAIEAWLRDNEADDLINNSSVKQLCRKVLDGMKEGGTVEPVNVGTWISWAPV